ncbi:hypothetical protein SLEP1_g829 [Rubroshorea leprosula]|uniref:Uncharacterized protein n=1 Tax=Rubroshorea leprosula TaxID=152421 RepID=A0AAV5HHP2_9ROSI|nr:hypothetical protein SLEP1_g829 [Rubroshorea leprosula]
MIAFWSEGDQCAFVYMIKPLDALNNLIPKESFSWLQRIMVTFRFAFVLEIMHSNKAVPYLIRNLDAAHKMVDKNLCITSHHAEALSMSPVGGISETQKDKLSGLFCKYFQHEQILNKELSEPTIILAGKECEMMRILSSEDLSFFTNGFSEENFIGDIQFGRASHGEMEGRKVIVKTWDKGHEHLFNIYTGELEVRLKVGFD